MYRNTHIPGPRFEENGDNLRNERWLYRNIEKFQFRYGGTYWESQHWKVETGGTRVQVHPWLHSDFEVILAYMRPYLKNLKEGREEKINDVKGEGGTPLM